MPLSLRLIPGYQFSENEKLTQTKLNQLGRPTIDLEGAISAAQIPPGSITSDKLAPGLISGLSTAIPDVGDWMMFDDRSAGGLRKATIGDILALSTPHLDQIIEVAFDDYAWIIQKGLNKEATIGNTLRQAIIGQPTELAAAADVDKAADMLLLWDASAAAGTNPNRKAKVVTAVTAVTTTLIEDAPAMVGLVDRVADELLLRDASLGAGKQQVRVTLQDLLAQVSGIKAWARINAKLTSTDVTGAWQSASDVITTSAPHSLAAGVAIWFDTSNAQGSVEAFTAYYVYPVDGTTLQLYTTKAGALAQTVALRVHIPVDNANKKFTRWPVGSNPILAGSNISAFIRSSTGHGEFRVYFDVPMADASYAALLTSSQGGSQDGNIAALDTETALPSSSSFYCQTRDDDGSVADAPVLSICVIR